MFATRPIWAALTLSLVSNAAYAVPMSGAFTGHVESQSAQPLGSPERLRIKDTAAGQNTSPGGPLDGAQVKISEVVTLDKGRGPVKGTITFVTPAGTTTSPYSGTVTTDPQGRVTAQGKIPDHRRDGRFQGAERCRDVLRRLHVEDRFQGRMEG